MFAYIVPLSKTFDDVGLLYKIPDSIQQNLKLGQVVEISIKNKIDF
ncbi:MAG: hypothetical protein LBU14_04830 [Candidatus Peribacteria bacterium]|jgi:hypothetical protein|nr:hypothetical protein [Candidatus Peribacteria bacterium]